LEIRMNISSAGSSHGTSWPMEAHASSDLPGFLSGCLRSEKQTAGDACQHHRGLKAQAQANKRPCTHHLLLFSRYAFLI
jgi:hypothetical protein